ncbi:MAG TPA: hypothetical protein VNX47_06335 [Nevskia sp.]|nr:hypothetical protein [Nevskia sp.]
MLGSQKLIWRTDSFSRVASTARASSSPAPALPLSRSAAWS